MGQGEGEARDCGAIIRRVNEVRGLISVGQINSGLVEEISKPVLQWPC